MLMYQHCRMIKISCLIQKHELLECSTFKIYNNILARHNCMQALEQLLLRVKTYSEMFLYNKKVIDPYLLASKGLIVTNRLHNQLQQKVASCSNQNCSLLIQFDALDNAEEEVKNDIQIAIEDHDSQCYFNQHQPISINYSLFREVGHLLFQARMSNIQKSKKFIQLCPKEIKGALNLNQSDPLKMQQQVNITFEMFRKLDKRLNGDKLNKVKSIFFLAVFGWQFSEANEIEMVCHFCASVTNVFEFISPSECTLMGLPNGFQFISSHRPWCCLIQQSHPYWREILKQAVIHHLDKVQGKICKSPIQIKCKQIQDNAAKMVASRFSHWSSMKKRLQQISTNVESAFCKESNQSKETKEYLKSEVDSLFGILEKCKEITETFVKRIKVG